MGTSSLFVFAHGQYLVPNAYSLGMVISLLCLAFGFGVIFAWTRSLVPSIVAHAFINVPMTPAWQGVCLMLFMGATVFLAGRGCQIVKTVIAGSTVMNCLALAAMGACWAIAGQRFEYVEYLAAWMVIVAIVLHFIDRRRLCQPNKAPEPTTTAVMDRAAHGQHQP